MSVFNKKNFNAEVFGKYVDTIPRIKQNAFLKAGIFRNRTDLKTMLSDQTGGNFITLPIKGRIGGDAVNYDGNTDITTSDMDTYLQSMIVVGRAKGWEEKDFTFDITGHDFMKDIAGQVSDYWDDINQNIILSILKGIFVGSSNAFATSNTLDITAETNTADQVVGPATLNNTIQKAAGANKNIFTLAIMHSAVATNLENLQLLEYAKYTDENGIQKQTGLATWNGRTVLVDDDVPVEHVAEDTSKKIPAYDKYTTYVLGKDAFTYCDCGVKTPYETDRKAAEDGGIDVLYSRERKLYAPFGFSFVQPSAAIVSPTNAQLEAAANWTLVKNTSNERINTKSIPIARIISKG